jgi:hypothetical protein
VHDAEVLERRAVLRDKHQTLLQQQHQTVNCWSARPFDNPATTRWTGANEHGTRSKSNLEGNVGGLRGVLESQQQPAHELPVARALDVLNMALWNADRQSASRPLSQFRFL